MTLKTVLVGTSLTDACLPVVEAARDVARAAGARVFAVHAFELPLQNYAGTGFEVGSFDVNVYEVQESAHREAMDDQLSAAGLDPDELAGKRVWAGTGHGVLLDTADEVSPDLIVVGATERGRIEERLLGSTADRVVRGAHCPVLIVRGTLTWPPGRVLAPVDLSGVSKDVLLRGLDVLDAAGGAPSLHLLYVLSPPQAGTTLPFDRDELEELARLGLERLAESLPGAWASRASTELLEGHPESTIVEALGRGEQDLVILGTHGRGGVRRFLLGSVATGVARHAPCSTLIVPPPAEGGAVGLE